MKDLDELREEVFALTYCMKGMAYGAVEEMLSVDRVWYLKRLYDQLKQEADDVKRSASNSKTAPSSKSKGHKPRRR